MSESTTCSGTIYITMSNNKSLSRELQWNREQWSSYCECWWKTNEDREAEFAEVRQRRGTADGNNAEANGFANGPGFKESKKEGLTLESLIMWRQLHR